MKANGNPSVPDLVLTETYPLDNNTTTDLLEHQRQRTDSALFDQFVTQVPSSSSQTTPNGTRIRPADQQNWREINGDWRHQTSNPLTSHDLGNHRDNTLWFDADQMDVPLLNSAMVSAV